VALGERRGGGGGDSCASTPVHCACGGGDSCAPASLSPISTSSHRMRPCSAAAAPCATSQPAARPLSLAQPRGRQAGREGERAAADGDLRVPPPDRVHPRSGLDPLRGTAESERRGEARAAPASARVAASVRSRSPSSARTASSACTPQPVLSLARHTHSRRTSPPHVAATHLLKAPREVRRRVQRGASAAAVRLRRRHPLRTTRPSG
jgi:hypothetical protein